MSRTSRKRPTVEWNGTNQSDVSANVPSIDNVADPVGGTRPQQRGGKDARALQHHLVRRWYLPSTPARWSARRSLAFILVSSCILWVLIGFGTRILLRILMP